VYTRGMVGLLVAAAVAATPIDLYPRPYYMPDSMYLYLEGQKEWNIRHSKVSPLLKPPTNLSPGNTQEVVAQKVLSSRVAVVQDALKQELDQAVKDNGVGQSLAKSLDGVSSKVSAISNQSGAFDTSLCTFKGTLGYDMRSSTATAQSTCETYNARVVYRPFNNYYEASVFKVLDTGSKVGVKSTQFGNSCVVFLEGSW
jgi:hypothetical protein